jgi:hypothetical protein
MTLDWSNVIESTLLAVPVAVVIVWAFYRRSIRDLREGAAKLRELSEDLRSHSILLLEGMEGEGWIKLERDPDRKIIRWRGEGLPGQQTNMAHGNVSPSSLMQKL